MRALALAGSRVSIIEIRGKISAKAEYLIRDEA
jgi:hypothetical protein